MTMAGGTDKGESALIRTEVLNPLLRTSTLKREGKALLRSLRRALNDQEAVFSLHRLRDLVFFHPQKKPQGGKTVGLSGASGSEGATSLALLLGLTLGELKRNRVVFFDGRLDRKSFNLYTEMFGLVKNPLSYQNGSGYFQCYSTKNQSLCFLTPGAAMEAIELFSDEEVAQLIADLRGSFDYVVFDMPPLLRSSETRMLLPHLDLYFLVCAARKTKVDEVERARQLAAEVGGSIKGVILNKQKLPFWAPFLGKDVFF